MNPSEIPDALPADFPDEPPEPSSPYRNLLVPLVVVPAMIVMVLVLVWVFFGAMVESEKSPTENVERMIHGSSNEREQAAALLVGQILNDLEAERAGREPQWVLDPALLPQVRAAYEDLDPEDAELAYVLALVQFELGDAEGADRLIDLLGATEEEDPGARVRFLVVRSLGVIGPVLDPPRRERPAERVLAYLESDDQGLRGIAASALQGLPSDGTIAGLRAVLTDGRLDVRGSAAVSLSHLGDASGAAVLHELTDPEAYAQERARDPRLWVKAADVSRSRAQAVRALGRLGRPEDVLALEALERDEEDLTVLAEVRRVLERDADAPAEASEGPAPGAGTDG